MRSIPLYVHRPETTCDTRRRYSGVTRSREESNATRCRQPGDARKLHRIYPVSTATTCGIPATAGGPGFSGSRSVSRLRSIAFSRGLPRFARAFTIAFSTENTKINEQGVSGDGGQHLSFASLFESCAAAPPL
jgi:hypothetical protein